MSAINEIQKSRKRLKKCLYIYYLLFESLSLAEKDLNLVATLDGKAAYKDADFVVIAAPTNYDPKKNFFDTTHVEEVIELVLEVNPSAVMVIKSTIPVGYTKSAREKFSYRERQADGTMKVVTPNIIFAPEFLRESKALYDNLYPSRIIVGYDEPVLEGAAHTFASIIKEGAIKQDVPVTVMDGLPKEEYELLVRTCDVGMIFLDHRFTIPNYPSRILSYLSNKMPVLCATDPNTDIGRIAEENEYGYWCESNSVDAFTFILDKMIRSDREEMGEKGFQFFKENYLVDNTYNAIMKHLS